MRAIDILVNVYIFRVSGASKQEVVYIPSEAVWEHMTDCIEIE